MPTPGFRNAVLFSTLRDNPCTLTVKTDNAGSASDTFVLPLPGSGTYDYSVDWGDGTSNNYTANTSQTHVYPAAGVYTLKIRGVFPRILFDNGGDRLKLLGVRLGNIAWGSFSEAFYGCSNLVDFSDVGCNTAAVTTMQNMFRSCSRFNQSVASFNTAAATNMQDMFSGCSQFNQSVANFNTAAVTTMQNMFSGCSQFNQSVANFNTAAVTNMRDMFSGCSRFNQSVASFNTAAATNMQDMFSGCSQFNQSVANFNTAAVTTMQFMFSGCSQFNQSVANFNTAAVTTIQNMFRNCSQFNQDISHFNIGLLTNATNMLLGSAFNQTNYDLLLASWAIQSRQSGVTFSAGTAKYGAGTPAANRATIAATPWTITDGGPA